MLYILRPLGSSSGKIPLIPVHHTSSTSRTRPLIHIPCIAFQPYYCGVEAPETSAGGGESRSTKYLKFGHSMTETFACDLRSLLGEEAFFYDPYIVDEVPLHEV